MSAVFHASLMEFIQQIFDLTCPGEEVLFHAFHARNDTCKAEKTEIGVLAD